MNRCRFGAICSRGGTRTHTGKAHYILSVAWLPITSPGHFNKKTPVFIACKLLTVPSHMEFCAILSLIREPPKTYCV